MKEHPLAFRDDEKEDYLKSIYSESKLDNVSQIKRNTLGKFKPHHRRALSKISHEFSPPIYIGHSKNIQTRVKDHFKDLELLNDNEYQIADLDNCFGSRIKKYLGDNFIKEDLRLKIIYDKNGILRKEDFEIMEGYMLSVTRPIISLK